MNRSILALAILAVIACARTGVASPIQWSTAAGGNNHFYEVVTAGHVLPWATAELAAESTGGYLATVTSAAEKDFLVGTFGDFLRGTWIGGYQSLGSVEPAGGWKWITGEPFVYTNWEPTEPNNSGGQENHLVFATAGSSVVGVWNDLDGVNPPTGFVGGYVVERVPEPSTISIAAVAAIGALGFAWRNRRRPGTTFRVG